MPEIGDRKGEAPYDLVFVEKICARAPGDTRRGLDGCEAVGPGWYPVAWLPHGERDSNDRLFDICAKCLNGAEAEAGKGFRESLGGDAVDAPTPRDRLTPAPPSQEEDPI